jgi:hypothetical protein
MGKRSKLDAIISIDVAVKDLVGKTCFTKNTFNIRNNKFQMTLGKACIPDG